MSTTTMKRLITGFLCSALAACAGETAEQDDSTRPLIAVTEANERGVAGSYEPETGLVSLSTTVLGESLRLAKEEGMVDPFVVLEVDTSSAFEIDSRTGMTTVNMSLLDAQEIQARLYDHETRFFGLIADLYVGTEQDRTMTPAFEPTAIWCYAYF
jgi:hypothetical protein